MGAVNAAERAASADLDLAGRCLVHDEAALRELRDTHYQPMLSVLVNRGATTTQAVDLMADLWGDLIASHDGKDALLIRYRGNSPLGAWLVTVATNRFIDATRRRDFPRGSKPSREEADFDEVQNLTAPERHGMGDDLLHLLLGAVKSAFQSCPPEALVMLKLVYVHEISQRQLAQAWGWHEAKVSRFLAQAMEDIRDHVLAQVRTRDRLLDVSWDDFLHLCRNAPEIVNPVENNSAKKPSGGV